MKLPWAGKSGLAKSAAFFATLLLVSSGLCGINFFVVLRFVPLSGGSSLNEPGWPSALLSVTAFIELVGIAVGVLGLIAAAIVATGIRLRERSGDNEKRE